MPAAVDALGAVGHRTGRVFLTARKQPYRSSEEYGGQIKTGLRRACRVASIPLQGAHAFRRTWATWQYAINPDPLRLMRDGGWSSLALVERYAALMPAGFEDEIRACWGLAVVGQGRVTA